MLGLLVILGVVGLPFSWAIGVALGEMVRSKRSAKAHEEATRIFWDTLRTPPATDRQDFTYVQNKEYVN